MSCLVNDRFTNRTPVVPISSARFPVEPKKAPRDFAFLLLPEFTFLAFAAALDPLRIANQLAQRPLYHWSIWSEAGEPVSSSCAISVNVDGPLTDFPKETAVFICSGLVTRNRASARTLAALRHHARHGGLVGGICTGALTLAQAGLLQSRTATLHWENQPAFREEFPEIAVTANIFEMDQNIVTCSGGSAATDMTLKFIEADYGAKFADTVAEMYLRNARRPHGSHQRSSISNQIGSRNPRLVDAVKLMQENVETPLSIEELATQTDSSRRQLERLFLKHLNVSPGRYYRDLRLDHGRTLLRETDMAVIDIAMACGFSSTSVFSRVFRDRFKKSPTQYQGE